ncbi:rhamnogalacturonan acetylesterase [Nonomuraea soli]|uniref:Lysophospholipase L1-like esterase n=1 Tax=Nonomuraea soli TaxID=1032476 RepID=A0A7W0CD17_9ACTN|nr:rhamnogalacturonan acetylesterase [Nonomuraea soli]MBA2888904.1 lysophospholipase L1-like esterase [Nonomuraea soli]
MRIFIAGDSTASAYPEAAAPMAGWGQALGLFVDADIVNEAIPGASVRSSIERLGMHERIMAAIGPGDLLLVCFGHNDPKHDQDRFSAPFDGYQVFLRRYLDGARERGARPILVTSVERRSAEPTHGRYPEAMKELAGFEGVPLIDLQEASLRFYGEVGVGAAKALFVEVDDTHFTAAGAIEVARLLAGAAGDLLPWREVCPEQPQGVVLPAERAAELVEWRTEGRAPGGETRSGAEEAGIAVHGALG